MPLFTRRRLQLMLDDIASQLSDEKARDLLRRLENKRVDQALPAEMELALLWALSAIGEIDIEPRWWGDDRHPDAYTEALVPGEPAVVEIAAPNDNVISGEQAMDGVAFKICLFANSVRRAIGGYLYFHFREESGYEGGSYFRRRLAPVDYELSEQAKQSIRYWIESGAANNTRLRIRERGLDIELEKKAYKQIRYHNIRSTMPPEAHSIDDNPLYKLLKRKLDQLRAARHGTLRFIFLGDAGSTLLNRIGRIGEIDPTRRRVSGREIISSFVNKYCERVDSVVVVAPARESMPMQRDKLHWRVSIFNRPGFNFEPNGLQKLVRHLPRPRFEGYQARSLFRQGLFNPFARGWWLGMHIQTRKGGPMKAKVSARALVDLLAGRISVEQFRSAMGEREDEGNLFKHWLDRGLTLQGVEFESGGTDEDDDFLVLSFADDAAARTLKLPDDTQAHNNTE